MAENIVDTVREPMIILNEDLTIHSVNKAFYRVFKTTPEDTVGENIYELEGGYLNIPAAGDNGAVRVLGMRTVDVGLTVAARCYAARLTRVSMRVRMHKSRWTRARTCRARCVKAKY